MTRQCVCFIHLHVFNCKEQCGVRFDVDHYTNLKSWGCILLEWSVIYIFCSYGKYQLNDNI